MTTRQTDEATGTSTEEFDRDLETLLFEAFAKGATVQGVREISSASSAVPGWRISIEKIDDAATPNDGGTFLDE